MNRVAALSEKDRNELFTVTAEKRGMGTIAIVEKDFWDFWVCWALKFTEDSKLAEISKSK